MKFAVVCPHYGYINRGTENMTKDINKILNKHGHHTTVFSLQGDITINSLRKDKGLGKLSNQIEEKTMLGGALRKYVGITPNIEDIAFSLRAYQFLDALVDSYDLLWSNGEFWCANMLNKLRKKHNKPILLFFGGGISKMMEVEAKMLPDVFVVLTPLMKKWVKWKVPNCNVKCIPSGVDLELFKKTKPLQGQYQKPVIVSTSALIEGKRIDLIIDALDEMGKGTLLVTSDGPLRKTLITKGKHQLGDRFKYLGILPFEDMPRLYSLADAFVLASRNEPYGAVLFEAMACGCPVVAQGDPTRKWMVGEGGELVDNCSNKKELASTIEKVCENKNNYKTREQAEKFSWEKTVNGYIEEIQKVV